VTFGVTLERTLPFKSKGKARHAIAGENGPTQNTTQRDSGFGRSWLWFWSKLTLVLVEVGTGWHVRPIH